MHCRSLISLVALGSSVACWAQGRSGLLNPVATLDGYVVAFETGLPIPRAEVCFYGTDTTCARADARGRFKVNVTPGIVTARFRAAGLPLAVTRNIEAVKGAALTVNCAIANRVTLADESACLPVAGR